MQFGVLRWAAVLLWLVIILVISSTAYRQLSREDFVRYRFVVDWQMACSHLDWAGRGSRDTQADALALDTIKLTGAAIRPLLASCRTAWTIFMLQVQFRLLAMINLVALAVLYFIWVSIHGAPKLGPPPSCLRIYDAHRRVPIDLNYSHWWDP